MPEITLTAIFILQVVETKYDQSVPSYSAAVTVRERFPDDTVFVLSDAAIGFGCSMLNVTEKLSDVRIAVVVVILAIGIDIVASPATKFTSYVAL